MPEAFGDVPKQEETAPLVGPARSEAFLAMRDRFLRLQDRYSEELERIGDAPLVADVVLQEVIEAIDTKALSYVLELPHGIVFAELLGQIAKQCFLHGYLWAKGEEEQKAIREGGASTR